MGSWVRVFWLTLGVCFWCAPAQAHDFVGSGRFGLGFGGRIAEGEAVYAFEMSLRSDLLTTLPRPSWLRIGPAVELRSTSAEQGFRSFEGAAGFSLSVDLGEDAALALSSLCGGGYRADRPSTLQWVEELSLGFTDWESRPHYATSTRLFVAMHAAFGADVPFYELTGGIEVDLLFLGTPFIALRDRIRSR